MSASVTSLRLASIVALALTITLFVFAPRLWMLRTPIPDSFQWNRGDTFLSQCESPFRSDVEPAMRWRLLPPLVAHTAGLTGRTPLVIPWIGAIAVSAYVAVLFRRRLENFRWVFGGTLLFTSTSAVLVPLHWFGMNDAWSWLGLLGVAFGRSRWTVPAACIFCPWVDERFLIGFPLAWLVARFDRNESWFSNRIALGLWLVPYCAVRLIWSAYEPSAAATSVEFVETSLRSSIKWLPMAPVAWWLGLRGAWIPVAHAAFKTPPRLRVVGASTLGVTLVANAVLAADLSRSVATICPLILLGCFTYARENPDTAPQRLFQLALVNLVLPTAHIVYNKIDVINPLPVEIARLFSIPA